MCAARRGEWWWSTRDNDDGLGITNWARKNDIDESSILFLRELTRVCLRFVADCWWLFDRRRRRLPFSQINPTLWTHYFFSSYPACDRKAHEPGSHEDRRCLTSAERMDEGWEMILCECEEKLLLPVVFMDNHQKTSNDASPEWNAEHWNDARIIKIFSIHSRGSIFIKRARENFHSQFIWLRCETYRSIRSKPHLSCAAMMMRQHNNWIHIFTLLRKIWN